MLALLAAAALTATGPAAAPPRGPPPGPELWRGARAGMTQEQVHALFPMARQAPANLITRPPVANAVVGGSAIWAVDEEVFGRPAYATYYFGPSGLLEVVVNVKGLRLRHTRDNFEIARGIRAGLLQYYGRPTVCEDTAKRGLDRLDCRWVTPSVQVGLSYVDYGGLSPNLDVAVRAPAGRLHETGPVFGRHGAT
ncbi:hypothetical protein [Caulobacter sp. S45]|uniref:hypothetical protein n=1 Tax=Caulobacter sp. S45 TaxID=1641861 RepID=UPI0015769605|nr:hypothetical protein [Caulobacter sp. S45]